MLLNVTLTIQAFSTFAMVGVIWFVQHVHYPLFAAVGREGFLGYESAHQRLTTHVVMPLMLAEAATVMATPWLVHSTVSRALAWTGLVLLGVIWASTFFWQVPLHEQLSNGFDADVQRRLVQSNWLRTIAWTLRGAIIVAVCWVELTSPE